MLNVAKPRFSSGTKIIYLFFIVHCTLNIENCYTQWVLVANGMGNRYVSSLAGSGNNVFAGTYQNGVYVSTNNGINWSETSLNLKSIYSLKVSGSNIIAGTFGIYLSTNNGASWTQTLNNRMVRSLAVNGNNVFAGTYGYGVYLSTNSGTNWTQTSLNFGFVFSLAVNGNSIFAGTDYGMFLSANNGTSWTQTLNNQVVYSLAVSGNNIFAGTDQNGFFVSNNNGTIWIQRNEGLGNAWVLALCILNNYIFAGTYISVYRRPLGELIGIKPISNEIPNQFSLSQNYPNPFNPMTKIKFGIPSVGTVPRTVRLIIYDILGREAAILVNEELKPGTYEIDWNAGRFSSGVYYYKLTASDYSETKIMVLIK